MIVLIITRDFGIVKLKLRISYKLYRFVIFSVILDNFVLIFWIECGIIIKSADKEVLL